MDAPGQPNHPSAASAATADDRASIDALARVPGPAGEVVIGPGRPLAIIAGPCALESLELGLEVARRLADACHAAGLPYVFKASFDKANRSSAASPRGPGLARGLDWLARVGEAARCPVTTDVHLPEQASPAAAVAGMLQIPAFLCRQSDLLAAAADACRHVAGGAEGRGGPAVNVKKGQFLSPREMAGPVRKLHEHGWDNVLLTERGTFFGYHRLVNDFLGLGDLLELDCAPVARPAPPVCFDVTHSTQLPGAGEQTGGRPERAPLLARAAAAAGVHALFLECHPDPASAASDGATQLTPPAAAAVIAQAARVRRALDAAPAGG